MMMFSIRIEEQTRVFFYIHPTAIVEMGFVIYFSIIKSLDDRLQRKTGGFPTVEPFSLQTTVP